MQQLAQQLIAEAAQKNIRLCTAESCTGGLIAAALTDVPGSSEVFVQGIVSYANEAKAALLRVDDADLVQYGAVSEPVARAMAEGAVSALSLAIPAHEGGLLSIAVTGIAGPSGGSEAKPVGTVHLASSLMQDNKIITVHNYEVFAGDRQAVREQTVVKGLEIMLQQLQAD